MYKDEYGVEFSDDKTTLEYCPKKIEGKYKIPQGVTKIKSEAFKWCNSLEEVEIPTSVTEIGWNAFHACICLREINLPYSITKIRKEAFKGCKCLKKIYIPSNVIEIARGVFSGCESLKSIIVDKGNPMYDSRNNCNAIIETKNNKLIVGCGTTIILNSVIEIEEEAFVNYYGKSITIPNSITEIGGNAFNGNRLEKIIIPKGEFWRFREMNGLRGLEDKLEER